MFVDNGFRKIGVFYDGNFLLHASNYYNYSHFVKRRISLNGLHEFICRKVAEVENVDRNRCEIVEAHYFRGRLNAADALQRGNQLYNDRVFDDILMSEGIHSHYLPLRNLQGRREERGVDVWLSLEAFEISLRRSLDVIVLILSDTDYIPLLRKLKALGIRVMLLGWEFDYISDDGNRMVTRTSHDLIQLATYPVAMHKVIETGLASGDILINNLFVAGENLKMEDADIDQYDDIISYIDSDKEVSEILSIKNGFGFVKYPNNNLFFHNQDVIGNFNDLEAGDKVEFTIGKNDQGQDVAKNVRKISE